MRRTLAVFLLALLPLTAANAATEPMLLDPVAQRRLVDLSAQLRCLVCQNQSIAESNAELAVDLRNQINEQIKAGRTDKEIVDFMVTRYGDFVLYRPPFKATTVLLWVGPIALLLLAVFAFYRTLSRRRARIEDRPLNDAERAEAERLLAQGSSNKTSS
ncbi:MAG TPA: cytochrome c-type biogenesis protein CcmH [Burkholderiaceae bacterium]|nr:cytochrome c-type biogenesis protein CcmH [Burkholderiaceae bacterium]HQR75629.1 cytochrome c-type biogenesis protein CcmH [Burkholderiaceae bacterium]